MKGLKFCPDSDFLAQNSIDLTKNWSRTILNASYFQVLDTDIYVRLCGEFDKSLNAYILGDSTIVISHEEHSIYVINAQTLKTKIHHISWSSVDPHDNYIAINGTGDLLIIEQFSFREYCPHIYHRIKYVEIIDGIIRCYDENRSLTEEILYREADNISDNWT